MSHFYSLTVHSGPNSLNEPPNTLMYLNTDLLLLAEALTAYTYLTSAVSTKRYGWLVTLNLVTEQRSCLVRTNDPAVTHPALKKD